MHDDLASLYDEALKNKKFQALIDLKTDIINKHSEAGVVYLLEKENLGDVVLLREIEDSKCPWFPYKTQSISSVIDTVWAPTKEKLPHFLALLKKRCKYILSIQNNESWQLVYVVEAFSEEQTPFYLFYNGGSPISLEIEEERQSLSQKYQGHLGLFYQVHNGFGELYRESILPFDELSRIKVEGIFYWSFFDFVSKARQCIKASDLMLPNPVTYDHEKGNLRAYHHFWQFLDERLALIDEE